MQRHPTSNNWAKTAMKDWWAKQSRYLQKQLHNYMNCLKPSLILNHVVYYNNYLLESLHYNNCISRHMVDVYWKRKSKRTLVYEKINVVVVLTTVKDNNYIYKVEIGMFFFLERTENFANALRHLIRGIEWFRVGSTQFKESRRRVVAPHRE